MYFQRFSPDLQAILCDISASVWARAENISPYVSAVDNWAAEWTLTSLVVSYYTATPDCLTALPKRILLEKECLL